MTTDEVVAKATEVQGKLAEFLRGAKDATPAVRAAADQVRAGFIQIAARHGENVDDLLTGDHIADRRTLESAKLIDAMSARIDWARVPAEAYKIAKSLGPAIAALV